MRKSPMSLRSTSGLARVSAMWMIAVVVLFLAAVGFAFIASSDRASEQRLREAAEAERATALEMQRAEQGQKNEVSRALGWHDPQAADPVSNVARAKEGLSALGDVFADLSETDTTYESVIPKLISAYNAQASTIGELQNRIKTLESELQEARRSVDTVAREKDDVSAGLRTELADEKANAEQRQRDLESRRETAESQTAERDLELRDARAALAAAKREWDLERQRLDARVRELARATRFAREPFSLYPDGKILEVSEKLPLAWIDLGANQRLTRGTRFRVESGTPGNPRFKAWAEVTRVEANRSEVSIADVVDPFDPVVAGDTILNPLYDPKGGRNAVLCGRFSGTFNERELTLLLERMGIHVQAALDRTTHFLIVGSELWADPETDEPLDEPIQPSELAVYKDAEANGVQIIPLQDIREFFRVESGIAGS
ncbi:MAG: hypothetical protein AB1726_04870 [Planctomycetota bacterium]